MPAPLEQVPGQANDDGECAQHPAMMPLLRQLATASARIEFLRTTEVLLQCRCAGDHLIEHAAESWTIYYARLHGEADDAAGELIHDDHHPIGVEDQGFTTKEIDAPEAVLGVSEEVSL
jgi:hypothetical protein